MDIDLLSKLVKDLIFVQDSVTLPGVGTFVAEMVGASFADRGFSINPPYRKLTFRQRQDPDDSLIRRYAQEEGVEDAGAELEDFLEGLKDVLFRDKSVTFPGLGRLRATRENHIFFVPDEGLDIFPDGYGFEAVSLKSHISDSGQTVIVPRVRKKQDPAQTPGAEASGGAAVSSATVPAVETAPAAGMPCRGTGRKTLKILLWTAVVASALLALLAIMGRICPTLVDRLLYSAEELTVLYS